MCGSFSLGLENFFSFKSPSVFSFHTMCVFLFTVSLPEIPADKYEEIVSRVDFPAKVQFLTRLTSYWLLRRQALNGVPLIKRLHMNHLQKQQQKTQAAIEKCENDNVSPLSTFNITIRSRRVMVTIDLM